MPTPTQRHDPDDALGPAEELGPEWEANLFEEDSGPSENLFERYGPSRPSDPLPDPVRRESRAKRFGTFLTGLGVLLGLVVQRLRTQAERLTGVAGQAGQSARRSFAQAALGAASRRRRANEQIAALTARRRSLWNRMLARIVAVARLVRLIRDFLATHDLRRIRASLRLLSRSRPAVELGRKLGHRAGPARLAKRAFTGASQLHLPLRPALRGLAVLTAGASMLLSAHLFTGGEHRSSGDPESGSYRAERNSPAERRHPDARPQRHEQRQRSDRHHSGSGVDRHQGSGGSSSALQVSEAPRDVEPSYAPPEPVAPSSTGGGSASEFGFEG